MPVTRFLIDTNLLVLLVVGNVNPDLIAKHRRLEGYTFSDYEVLIGPVNLVDRVFLTPNTLTKASNLLGQHGEPERTLLMDGLRALIEGGNEIVIASAQASANPAFPSLGLTDAVLLEAASEERPLVTVDARLYSLATAKGQYAAWDFLGELEIERSNRQA